MVLVTGLADFLGQGPAGFIGGLPTLGAVNLLSIGLTTSTAAAVEATTLFPLGFGSTCAFLLFYAAPKTFGFRNRMLLALGLWLSMSAGIAFLAPADFALSVVGGFAIAFVALFVRARVLTAKVAFVSTKPSARLTVMRGILGGSAVTSVVLLSVLGGPVFGGVFAAAPAIWSSSLYVTSRTKGIEFSRSLTWTFMKTGVLTVMPYGIAARFLFSAAGIWWGTLLSYISISPLAFLAWKLNAKGGHPGAPLQVSLDRNASRG